MASFETHVNIAVIATGVLIVPFYTSELINTKEAFILLSLGLVGGILPDLDSDSSKPIQIVFKILSIFFPLLVLLSLSIKLPLLQLLFLWLALGVVLQFAFSELFLKQTVHRGIFHSLGMGIVMSQLIVLFFLYLLEYTLLFSTLSALFLFFGFSIHLLLDEMSSINALGLSIKKSFGTALKLYDKNNIKGSIMVYTLILIFSLLIPYNKDVFTKIFATFKSINLL